MDERTMNESPAGERAPETGWQSGEVDFRLLTEMIPHMVWSARPDGSPDYWNTRLLNFLDRTEEQMQGWAWAESLHPDDRQRTIRTWSEAIVNGADYSIEYRMRRGADCQYFWHLAKAMPLRDGEGNIIRWFGTCTDIEDLKRTEERLQESEERFRSIMALSPDVISIVTEDGLLAYCSPSVHNMLGYAAEEIQGTKVLELIHHDDRPQIEAFIATMRNDPSRVRSIRYRCLKKDGTCCWLESVSSSQLENPYVRGIISASRDITERKKMEEALQESEQRYRAIVESQTEYVSRFLPGGVLTYVNQALAKWYGAEPEELIGQSLYAYLQAHDREELVRKIESLTCDSPPVTVELAIAARNGNLRWQQWTDHAICDIQGRIVEYQGVGRDITEKKEAELYLAQAKETLEKEVAERTASLLMTNAQLNREVEERRRVEQHLLDHQRKLEEMSLELSLAADRERARIAGELHDQVGQRLILSRMKLDSLANRLSGLDHEQACGELLELTDQTIRDIRSLTFQLRPPILATAGLVAAIHWLGEELRENYGLSIQVEQAVPPINLSYEAISSLFQVVRELLLNVAKHANTDHAVVSITTVDDSLSIIITDYGVGCDITRALTMEGLSRGFGLFNIRHRVEHLGGRLTLESMPGEGCRASILVPLSQAS